MIDSIFAKGGKLAQAASASLLSGSDRRKKRAKEGLAISAILELFKVGKEEQEQLKATDLFDLQSELNLDSKRSEYIYNDEIAPVLTAEKNYRDNGGGGKLLLDKNNKPVLTEDGRLQFAKLENGELARGAGNSWFLNNSANPRNANVVFQSSDDYIEMAGAKGYQYLTKADKEAIQKRKQDIADMLEKNHLNKINNPLFKDQNITNPIDFFEKGVYNKYKASVDEINQDPTRARVGGYLLSKISKYGDDTNMRLREATGKAQKIQKKINGYVEELRQPSQGMPTSSVLSGRYRGDVKETEKYITFKADIAEEILTQEGFYTEDFEVDMLTYNPEKPFDLTAPFTSTNPFAKQNTKVWGLGGDSIEDMWGRNGKLIVMQTAMQDGQRVVQPFNENDPRFVVPAEKFANMIASTSRLLKARDLQKLNAAGTKDMQEFNRSAMTNENYELMAVNVLAQQGRIQQTPNGFVIFEFSDELNYLDKAELKITPKLDDAFASYRSNQIDFLVKNGESGENKDRISALESNDPQVNALETFKFLINPPEDLKGTPVKLKNKLLSLGNIPESTVLQMYENYKGKFGDSFVLENIIKELYPTETETEVETEVETKVETKVEVEPVVTESDVNEAVDLASMTETELEEYAARGGKGALSEFKTLFVDRQNKINKETLQKFVDTGKKGSFHLSTLKNVGLPSNATQEMVAKYLSTNSSLLASK